MKAPVLILSTLAVLAASSVNTFPHSKAIEPRDLVKRHTAEFAFLRTHRQGKGVVASWAINFSQEIISFQLQRTYQDPSDPYSIWENVISIPYADARSFQHNDKDVLPGRIYYRVIAALIDGNALVSEVSGVRIVSH